MILGLLISTANGLPVVPALNVPFNAANLHQPIGPIQLKAQPYPLQYDHFAAYRDMFPAADHWKLPSFIPTDLSITSGNSVASPLLKPSYFNAAPANEPAVFHYKDTPDVKAAVAAAAPQSLKPTPNTLPYARQPFVQQSPAKPISVIRNTVQPQSKAPAIYREPESPAMTPLELERSTSNAAQAAPGNQVIASSTRDAAKQLAAPQSKLVTDIITASPELNRMTVIEVGEPTTAGTAAPPAAPRVAQLAPADPNSLVVAPVPNKKMSRLTKAAIATAVVGVATAAVVVGTGGLAEAPADIPRQELPVDGAIVPPVLGAVAPVPGANPIDEPLPGFGPQVTGDNVAPLAV